MSRYPNKSLKRKIEECQDEENGGGRSAKEVKKDSASEEGKSFGNCLTLLRLSSEDWSSVAVEQDDEGETNIEEEDSERGSVSRGTLWTGKDASQQIHKSPSQLSVACKRFANGSSSFDCETQTYYFLPKSLGDTSITDNTPQDRREKEACVKNRDSLVSVCCVVDCESQSSVSDSSITYYGLPSSNTERSLWADILGVVFADVPGETTQEICSKHFVASASSPCVRKSSSVPKSLHVPKSRTRKKRTCDILIAEEAEKVKQSMVTGRAKRTPKPNRNYDWAELIPLIKSEGDDIEEIETPVSKTPVKHSSVPGRRRKQPLDDIKREEKENERPYMEVHLDLCNETGIPDLETDDYGINISLPSMPRAPPPKPKGRPHKIQDTCTQTDGGLCTSRGPLREVKVQCNLTAEPLVTCSSCSNIDWKRLDEQLSSFMSIIEGDICNPVIARSLKKFLSDITTPSHASNVLRMVAGIERDLLESGRDIILVSSQDEEVEIENVIHEEEAPITGMREITPKIWNKKSKVGKEVKIKTEENTIEDHDSLGLKEATDRDDEEFQPEYAALEEEEEEEDLDEMDDDDDWDIKNEDESGVPIPRKKKPRQKMKKERNQETGPLQQGSRNKDEAKCSHSRSPKKSGSINLGHNKAGSIKVKNPLVCQICDEVFKNKHEVQIHVKQVHEKESLWFSEYRKSVSYQCKDCDEIFSDKISLSVHRMFKHGDPRRYQCDQCDYEGPRLYHLKRHLKVHSDERQYSCSECGKGFKSNQAYKNHMTRHTNEGRYKCSVCNKAYNNRFVYEDHVRSHRAEKNFECKYCGMAFKTYKHVACHVRAVHLNDKRFICDVCGTKHMSGINLKTHMKTHRNIDSLAYSHHCSICDSVFRGSKGLTTHMKVMHEMHVAVDDDELSNIRIMTPHPTRRSVKIEYNEVQSTEVENS